MPPTYDRAIILENLPKKKSCTISIINIKTFNNFQNILLPRSYVRLKENDEKRFNRNQNESVSKTKLFGANFMQIRL